MGLKVYRTSHSDVAAIAEKLPVGSVIDRKDDVFTLRFRDYPQLPKFYRHRSALALMNPPSE